MKKVIEKRSTLSLRIRDDIKEQAKVFAEKEHRSLSNFFEFLVLNWEKEHKYPTIERKFNEETLKSMEDTMNGIGVSDVDMSSEEAMWKSLGLYDEED